MSSVYILSDGVSVIFNTDGSMTIQDYEGQIVYLGEEDASKLYDAFIAEQIKDLESND